MIFYKNKMLLPIISSALGILAFSSLKFSYVFGFIFLAPIFIFILTERKILRLILGVFVFKIIFSIATFYFVFEPYGFVLSLLIFLGLPFVVFIFNRGLSSITQSLIIRRRALIILLPFIWLFFENLQARFSFLPIYIGTIANVFGNSPFVGLANIAGLNSVGFFAVLVNMLLAVIAANFFINNSSHNNKLNFILITAVIITIVFGWQVSQLKLKQNSDFYNSRPNILKIGLVSNNRKFDEEFLIFKNDILDDEERKLASAMIEESLSLLRGSIKNKNLDLLILPEEMIDIEDWNDVDPEAYEKFEISNNGILIKAYRKLAEELNANLVVTLTTVQNSKRYMTTILFNKKGGIVDAYNKSHLTIGGEYWPFGKWRPFYYGQDKEIAPKLSARTAIFNNIYQYTAGKTRKLLRSENLIFASLICVEIHYPNEMKIFKNLGARFISHTSSNRWIISDDENFSAGLKQYLYLTDNLRKIEAVWLKMPILINGRYERAGIITPSGQISVTNFESSLKDYGLFIGEIRY